MKKEQCCKECKQTFDLNKGGYYDKADDKYICLSCGNTVPLGEFAIPVFRKQSVGSIITKLIFSALCFGAIFYAETGEIGAKLVLGCVGLLLIVLTVLPYIRERQRMAAFREQQQSRINKEKSVYRKCENCGANTTGDVCVYCGSPMDQKH